MEKDPDAYNDADIDEVKVEIKQVEALIKELQLSIRGSTAIFESLRVQVSAEDGRQRVTRHNADKASCLASLSFRSQAWWRPWIASRRHTTRAWF